MLEFAHVEFAHVMTTNLVYRPLHYCDDAGAIPSDPSQNLPHLESIWILVFRNRKARTEAGLSNR